MNTSSRAVVLGCFAVSCTLNLSLLLFLINRPDFLYEGPWMALTLGLPVLTVVASLAAGARWGAAVGKAIFGGAVASAAALILCALVAVSYIKG